MVAISLTMLNLVAGGHESVTPTVLYAQTNDAYLQRLRREYPLDEVIKETSNDYEKVLHLAHWVSNLWEHDGDNVADARDPISILERVAQGERFRCVEYASVLAGCLSAVGVPARALALKTEDVETRELGAGHLVVEAYIESRDKWIMIDSQINVIPTLHGEPLNALEFREALSSERREDLSLDYWKGMRQVPNKDEYFDWIEPYLFYLDTRLDQRYDTLTRQQGSLMLVPEGAKKPKVFQRIHSIENMHYTHSAELFYRRPN